MGRRAQLCPEWQLPEDRSRICSLHPRAKRQAWHEAASGQCLFLGSEAKMFAFELFFQFIKRYLFGVSFLITPGALVRACLHCGKETGLWKEVQTERELRESPQKQVRRRWPKQAIGAAGRCTDQASSPAHKSLPPGSSCILSKMLPANCSELPGTGAVQTSSWLFLICRSWAVCLQTQRKERGLGRQKLVSEHPKLLLAMCLSNKRR